MTYVNYLGERIGLVDHGTPKKAKKDEADEFHKGWRVEGIPPCALQEAEKQHPRRIAQAIAWNERVAKERGIGKALPVPGPWDPAVWLNAAKLTPVRRKPYSIPQAAQECKALTERADWLRVEVVEIKKEKQKGTT